MTQTELTNLIDRMISAVQTDCAIIIHETKKINKTDANKIHLDWSLAHMRTSMLEFIRDLERHQKYLNESVDAT